MDTATEFREIFKANLRNYQHPFLGFDLLRFEKHFAPENLTEEANGKSLSDILIEKYGQRASDLIREILGAEQ